MQYRFCLASLALAFLAAMLQTAALASGTPAGTLIPAASTVDYLSGATIMKTTATVSSSVLQTPAVIVAAGAVPQSVTAGQSYFVSITATNSGNASDSVLLSATSAQSWPVGFLGDDNGDGVHQSTETTSITSVGPLAADGFANCFLSITVPMSATTGDTVTVKGTSAALSTAFGSTNIALPAPASHSVTFTQAPAASPTAVASAGSAACMAAATDSVGHAVNYAWSDGGVGGSFAPNASAQNPTYTAPSNTTASDVTVKLTCSATCPQNSFVTVSASASLTVHPVPVVNHKVTFTQVPMLSPSSIVSSGNTNCTATAVDSLGDSITYAWSDGGVGGSFAPSAMVQSPTYTATKNSSTSAVVVTLTCKASCYLSSSIAASASAPLTVQPAPAAGSTIPGDLNGDKTVTTADTTLFNQEWLKWHQATKPLFSAGDATYDLAPRVSGAWPNWTPIGDKTINIQDATAFTECLVKSKSATLAYSVVATAYRTTSAIFVRVSFAPYGIYQTSVVLPSGVSFKATLDANGNLARVQRSTGSGSVLYSEYDSATRTIRLTGSVSGGAPYMVAAILLN